jgi:two-component system cell cycle sensor histidine kinase/response regulator CckA
MAGDEEKHEADSHPPQEGDAHLRMLLETAFDGLMVSQDGRVVEVSRALLEMAGYSVEEVVGRSVLDFIAEEFRGPVQQRIAAAAEGPFAAVAVLKDGRRIHIEVVTKNVIVRGQPARITALRDVTEKRRLEEQLRHAQKMEALGRLASSVAHEFNNLLLVIRSYGDLLVQELGEPYVLDALEIVKAADAGTALTRQLLANSRQQLPRVKAIDVNAVVHGCGRMLSRLVGSQIEVVTDLDPHVGEVRADAQQLQQVIVNLVVNARDAMPLGGRLVIRTRNAEVSEAEIPPHLPPRSGRYVMVTVNDAGTGMSDEVKSRIFEPFFTTKEAGHGTGLGLAFVQGIVEQCRGFIVVDSTIGEGSTFAIYLPMLVGRAAATP